MREYCPQCFSTLCTEKTTYFERMEILADFAEALLFPTVASQIRALIPELQALIPNSFAQKEPEAPAGILGAGVSAPGEGAQPSPKTHASPARSAQSNPVEE